MRSFTEMWEDSQIFLERQAQDIAAIHEGYCIGLLNKHGITNVHPDHIGKKLEQLGYHLEHRVEKDGDDEVHVWRLFKLFDHSPRYKIKRAIAVEAKAAAKKAAGLS